MGAPLQKTPVQASRARVVPTVLTARAELPARPVNRMRRSLQGDAALPAGSLGAQFLKWPRNMTIGTLGAQFCRGVHHDEGATPPSAGSRSAACGVNWAPSFLGEITQIQKVIVLRDPQWGDLREDCGAPTVGAQGAQFRWLQP